MISSITSQYIKHDASYFTQGDILTSFPLYPVYQTDSGKRDVDEITFPYIVIVSQSCDLLQCKGNTPTKESVCNQFLPNILLLPAFTEDQIKLGTHLLDIYGIKQEPLSSKMIEKYISKDADPRYHRIEQDPSYKIPALIIDFKLYYTVPLINLQAYYSESYCVSLNELFRERLSQRFSSYLSRIGLPEVAPASSGATK